MTGTHAIPRVLKRAMYVYAASRGIEFQRGEHDELVGDIQARIQPVERLLIRDAIDHSNVAAPSGLP